jgi:uncharacterized protein
VTRNARKPSQLRSAILNCMSNAVETAGALLREARTSAGLSQAELGRRAGVTQSVISAYESGRRQPSLPTLARLVEATGSRLETAVRQTESGDSSQLGGHIGERLHARRGDVERAARRHGVSNLRVFGSVARGEETADGDVDLLVDLPADASLFLIARLQRELQEILGARVEIVSASDLKPSVRSRVEQELVAL